MMQDAGLAAVDVPGYNVDLVSAGRKNDILLIEGPLGLRDRHLALGIAGSLKHVFKHPGSAPRQPRKLGVEVERSVVDTALVLKGDIPVVELHREHRHYRLPAYAHKIGA